MTTDNLSYKQKIALAKEFLAQSFITASAQYGLDRNDVSRVALQLAFSSANSSARPQQTEPDSPSQPLPSEAPELWRKRDLNRRENAALFIRRVYAPWLGRGLKRSDLAELDRDLYKALSVWISRHPDDPIVAQLPPLRANLDEVMAHLSALYPLDVLRKLGYAVDARMRRKNSEDKIKMPSST